MLPTPDATPHDEQTKVRTNMRAARGPPEIHRLARCFAIPLSPPRAFRLIPARVQDESPSQHLETIQDAEAETLLLKSADPLFPAASLSFRPVRIILVRDRAIDGFGTTGNRMFINISPIGTPVRR